MKCLIKIVISFSLTFLINVARAQIEIIQLNQRFTLIKLDAKYVKATLLKPVEGLSIYSIESKDLPIHFDFVSRRANPWDEALHVTLKARNIIKKSKTIFILGASLIKFGENDYHTSWEYISGEGGCITYFTEEECPGSYQEELDYWKNKPIDYKKFPELFEKSYIETKNSIKSKINQN